MNWAEFVNEPAPIPTHALLAFAALGLGAVQLALPKGTLPHRVVGYVWVALMASIAVTGLFIHGIRVVGPFSPLHLLSLYVLYGLFTSIRHARLGNIAKHRAYMRQMYFFALVVAGAFTLLPGRAVNALFFGA